MAIGTADRERVQLAIEESIKYALFPSMFDKLLGSYVAIIYSAFT